MTTLPITEQIALGGERELLETFLDQQRREAREQLAGVSRPDSVRRLVPSLTTLAGLVVHLSAVERAWFQRVLAGRTDAEIGAAVGGGDGTWQVDPEATVDDLLAAYDRACAQSREIAAGLALDDSGVHHRIGRVSLRWVYLHMIEETARHAGHADILREQTDASRGA